MRSLRMYAVDAGEGEMAVPGTMRKREPEVSRNNTNPSAECCLNESLG